METASENLNMFEIIGRIFYYGWWLLIPFLFWEIFKVIWMDYVAFYSRDGWVPNQKWTMLEVIPPREIESGPKPMENVFVGTTGSMQAPNAFEQWLDGMVRDRFSWEIVSEEGRVHYYVRMQKKHRNIVEAQIYAQYPGAQVIEVEDYYNKFPKIVPNRDWDLWGADFEFLAEDYYPIRTHDKFKEDISGNIIDPMAAVVEAMGLLGPGQHSWLQFVVEGVPEGDVVKEGKKLVAKLKGTVAAELGFFDYLKDMFANFFSALIKGEVSFLSVEKKEQQPLEFRLSPMEKEVLKAVEENVGMYNFKTKMRLIVLGKRTVFDKPLMLNSIMGALKQFNDFNSNQFKPEDISKTYGKIFFVKGIKVLRQRKLYDRYRRRNMDGRNLVFSVKELATLYHFPNMVVKSPSITQTSGKLGAAPANLPIE